MNATDPTWRGYLGLFLGVLVVVGAVVGLAWPVGGRAGSDDGGRDWIDPELAAATDPAPAEGPPRRALDLGWATECAWRGMDPTESGEPTSMTELRLDLDPEDLDELYTRWVGSDTRLSGTYRLAEDGPSFALPDESVRFRGRSARALPKLSFNVRLHETLPELRSDRLNLNAMYTDPSMVREHLSMQVFREAGVPASRTSYVDLFLNDSYEGLYLYVQRVDDVLLAEHGRDAVGVTLVRDRSRDRVDGGDEPRSVFDAEASTPPDPEALVELFDHRGEPDWEAVAAFVAWVRGSEPGAAFAAGLEERVEVDELIDFLALHTLLGDVDAYYDDYWMYRPAGSARFGFVPWDKDLSFGAHFSAVDGGVANVQFSYETPVDSWVTRRNRLFDLVMTTPQLRERHDRRVGELADVLDQEHYCRRLVGLVPTIAESATATPGPDAFERHEANHVGHPADHDLHVAAVLDYVQLRAAFLERQIDPADGPSFRASTHVSEDDAGTSVLFTGSQGATVARLDVLEVDAPGMVEVAVDEAAGERDVDRRWSVRAADGTRVRGQLSLYYRNDSAREDWVRDEVDPRPGTAGQADDPVAAERELVVVDVTTSEPRPLASAANPFANRVAADVEIVGESLFALRRHSDQVETEPSGER